MNDSSSQPRSTAGARRFLATVWPATSEADSELQRRKKFALRCGQLAVAAMLVFAVVGRMAATLSWPQAAGLIAAGLVYVIWYLYGLRGAVRWMLWQRGAGPPPVWPPPAGRKEVVYFAIQLGLAGLICVLGGQRGSRLLVWLVLLPPVAQSAFMLRGRGVAVVSGISIGILVWVGGWQHGWNGWNPLPVMLEFFYAVLFTLVLTTLAVSSERARGEVERLAGELSAANGKLRAYAVQAEELAATRERNRLAREVHDSLGHYLTVVNVQIEAARALRERDPARTWDALDQAQALTQQGLQDIRRSVAALRASPLDDQPLAQVLHEVVNRSCATGLAAELQVWGQARALSQQATLALYRAGQEGLTNVRKHARVAQARLALDFREPTKVCLSVIDKGAGADLAAATAGGFGLLGLRERVQLLGGAVRVQTAPGAGFFLEVEVPG